MLKNKTKLFIILFTTLILISNFTFTFAVAEDEELILDEIPVVTTSEEDSHDHEDEAYDLANEEIYENDLYLFDADVTMDKLVNGNVYIFANTVKMTGQVAGNVYIFANKVILENSFIQGSAYIAANEIFFEGVATDLYATCRRLEIPANFGVYRDIKFSGYELDITGTIGRNLTASSKTISLEKDGNTANIMGDFEYYSNSEINVPEGSVQGETKFSKTEVSDSNTKNVQNYIFQAITAIVTTLLIYGMLLLICKKSNENFANTLSKKWLKSLLAGLLALIVLPIAIVILMITFVGVPFALLLLTIYLLLIFITTPIMNIATSKLISNKLKLDNKLVEVLILALISLVVWAIKLIPVIGPIISLLILIFGLGITVVKLFSKKEDIKTEIKE